MHASWEIDMGIIIEEAEQKPDLRTAICKGVTCIFCGLPTPVFAPAQKNAETRSLLSRTHVSLVRCEICGKEAPYLSSEVTEFGNGFRTEKLFFGLEHAT
jgi:hypothetical protein